MFIWGSGHKTLRVAFNDSSPCPACNSVAGRTAIIDYDYNHIFWMFKGLKNKAASVECSACGAMHQLDDLGQEALFAALGGNPIPLMDRYGAHVLVAVVVGWFGFAMAFPCLVNPDSEACALGTTYDEGVGAPQDYAEDVKRYRLAAEQGDAEAQFNLGDMYDFGKGVPQDYTEAVKWYRKAAEQGDVRGQFNLGLMYSKGEGVPQNYAEAMKWYRKAAEQGDAKAQYNLGSMYTDGQGVPEDYAEAMRWWRKAAEQGDARGQFNLGLMYSKGEGVPQDYVQAHKWFDLAVANFKASETEARSDAAANRDIIAAKLTPAQIAEAKQLAREWKPKAVSGSN